MDHDFPHPDPGAAPAGAVPAPAMKPDPAAAVQDEQPTSAARLKIETHSVEETVDIGDVHSTTGSGRDRGERPATANSRNPSPAAHLRISLTLIPIPGPWRK